MKAVVMKKTKTTALSALKNLSDIEDITLRLLIINL